MFSYILSFFGYEEVQADKKQLRQKYLLHQQLLQSKIKLKSIKPVAVTVLPFLKRKKV